MKFSSDRKTFTLTVSLTGTFDGTEVLKIRPSDDVDNDNDEYDDEYLTINVSVDSQVPTVSLSSINATVINGDNINITATFSEAMTTTPTINLSGVDINTPMRCH